MEKRVFEVEAINRKILKESHEFISKVVQYQGEVVEQIGRLNRDVSKMFANCNKDFSRIDYDLRAQARAFENEILAKEHEEIEKIRNMKVPAEVLMKKQKPKQVFENSKAKNRKMIKVGEKWKASLIPRPVWGIILEFCDPISIAKLERVCRMLFLLVNPKCGCTEIKGTSTCKSMWRKFPYPEGAKKYEDSNCAYIKRVILRDYLPLVLAKNIEKVKNISCKQNAHNWEVHPENPNIIRCPSCYKGAKRNVYCPGVCQLHNKMCLNEYSKFVVCRSHSCIACRVPLVFPHIAIIQQILSECSSYTLHPAIKLVFSNPLD